MDFGFGSARYYYNDEQDMIIGPLTKKNNHIDNTFLFS